LSCLFCLSFRFLFHLQCFPQRNVTNLCNLRLFVGNTFCAAAGTETGGLRCATRTLFSSLPSADCCRLSRCARAVKGLSQAKGKKKMENENNYVQRVCVSEPLAWMHSQLDFGPLSCCFSKGPWASSDKLHPGDPGNILILACKTPHHCYPSQRSRRQQQAFNCAVAR